MHGIDAAIERALLSAEAGAGLLFVEAATSAEEIRALSQRVDKLELMNMVIGGKTPIFHLARGDAKQSGVRVNGGGSS